MLSLGESTRSRVRVVFGCVCWADSPSQRHATDASGEHLSDAVDGASDGSGACHKALAPCLLRHFVYGLVSANLIGTVSKALFRG